MRKRRQRLRLESLRSIILHKISSPGLERLQTQIPFEQLELKFVVASARRKEAGLRGMFEDLAYNTSRKAQPQTHLEKIGVVLMYSASS
jgi:hypothetical protein